MEKEGGKMANKQGFSAMPKDKAKEIQRQGGLNSPMKFKAGDNRTKMAGAKGGSRSRRTTISAV